MILTKIKIFYIISEILEVILLV